MYKIISIYLMLDYVFREDRISKLAISMHINGINVEDKVLELFELSKLY